MFTLFIKLLWKYIFHQEQPLSYFLPAHPFFGSFVRWWNSVKFPSWGRRRNWISKKMGSFIHNINRCHHVMVHEQHWAQFKQSRCKTHKGWNSSLLLATFNAMARKGLILIMAWREGKEWKKWQNGPSVPMGNTSQVYYEQQIDNQSVRKYTMWNKKGFGSKQYSIIPCKTMSCRKVLLFPPNLQDLNRDQYSKHLLKVLKNSILIVLAGYMILAKLNFPFPRKSKQLNPCARNDRDAQPKRITP